MPVSRGLWVGLGLLAVMTAGVGSTPSGEARLDQSDPIPGSSDRRGTLDRATNVFVGQEVGERFYCLATSSPGDLMVYRSLEVSVERNLKGRVEGIVLVRQETDDTGRYGPDGRMEIGRRYLLMTRSLEGIAAHAVVDHAIGYALIDGPEERAELVAEVRCYLDDPSTTTPTAGAARRATWDVLGTRNAATRETYPTEFPCEPSGGGPATATAAAEG